MRYIIIIIMAFVICLTFVRCNLDTKDAGKPDPWDSMIVANSIYFDSIAINDVKLKTPQKGEWLHEHKETGQTFDEYKAKDLFFPSEERNTIYLLPYGSFTKKQMEALSLKREYYPMNT